MPPSNMQNHSASISSDHVAGLAASLQAAKLKKMNQGGSSENCGGSTTTCNNSSRGTLRNMTEKESCGDDMASMMDKMVKTLTQRRDKRAEEAKSDTKKSNGPRKGSGRSKKDPLQVQLTHTEVQSIKTE